tara:strand:+ start:465 stop:1064 length:600 start_codon:yes stop_codon:yes gene_type:complete
MLPPEDKIAFMDALLDRQFLGIKPENLKGMAEFAYVSQTNSIDSQVKGYEDKTRTKLNPLDKNDYTPTIGVNEKDLTPALQVEEKEKEKVEEVTTTKETENLVEDIFIKASKHYKTYAEQLYSDAGFIEALSRNQIKDINIEVCKNTIHKYLKEFLSHLNEYKHVHHNKKSFSANFSNWLRKKTIVKVYPKKEETTRYS